MKKVFLVLFVFSSALASAQLSDSVIIKKIVDETMTNATAYQNLRRLCKEVGPRLSGSPQYAKAVRLVSSLMKEGKYDTVYLQQCMVPHWVRGEKEVGHIISPDGKKYDLHLCALGNSVGSGTKGVTANIVEVNSMAQLNQLGSAVKGKIVFFNFPMNQTYIKTFQAYGESGVSRNRGPAVAGKYGAVGAMVRSLAINLNNYPHTGATGYNDSFPKIPAIALGGYDADYVWNLSKQSSFEVSFKTNGHFLPDAKGHNVVAELTGTEFPDQYITIGGHLDSWDVNEGASDDGTGVVQTMEILRALKKLGYRPKHTIRFVLFANEENGLRGGTKYAEEAKTNNEKHIFALESDEGGFTPRGFGFTIEQERLNKIQAWLPVLFPYGTTYLKMGGGGADIGPLNRVFGTPLAGFVPDNQRYFDLHHARSDVFENVNKRELLLGAINMTGLIYLVDKYGL